MPSTPRPIRFPNDLWEAVKARAETEDRAPSNMVVRLVREALASSPLEDAAMLSVELSAAETEALEKERQRRGVSTTQQAVRQMIHEEDARLTATFGPVRPAPGSRLKGSKSKRS